MLSVAGRHKDETIFVFGTGPSLELALPFSEKLRDRIIISAGQTFKTLPFRTTYYLLTDPGTYEKDRDAYLNLDREVFCPVAMERLPKYPLPVHWTRFYRHGVAAEMTFSPKWEKGLFWSGCCAAPAINLAYLFGAKRIALLGVDLGDYAHSYDKKTGKGEPFPFQEILLRDMQFMFDYLTRRGVECVNCSPVSAVKSWPYKDLRELL